jgi:hypothetical protein
MSSVSSSYVQTSGILFKEMDEKAEFLSRAAKLAQGITNIVLQSYALIGRKSLESAQIASDFFGTCETAISAMRLSFSFEKLFSGKMFWRQNEDGSFIRAQVFNNEYVTDENGMLLKDDLNGVKVPRDWLDIAIDTILIAGRAFSFISLLQRFKVDLGKHANWVGGIVISAFTAVTTLCTLQSIQKYIEETDSEKMRQQFADIICNFFDMLALPWETNLGFDSSPHLSLAGAIICSLAAGAYLLKEWAYYSP